MADEREWYIEPGGQLYRVKARGMHHLEIVCETTKVWAEQIVKEHNDVLSGSRGAEGLAAALEKAIRSHENLAELVFRGAAWREYREESLRTADELRAALAARSEGEGT